MRMRLLSAICAAALLAACGSTVRNPVTGQKERSVLSESSEVALGIKEHREVLQEYSVVDNPAVQAYVNALGQRLARLSHRSQLEWHFTVLDSPEINAFALPGGYVYVTRGIMAYMESEADLASVIRVLKSREQCAVPGGRVRGVGQALPAGSSGAATAADQWGLWRRRAAPGAIG